jgi:hypothetical protein
MKRLFFIIVFLLCATPLMAREKYSNWCMQGNKKVTTQGLTSTTTVQQSYPTCTITVYLAGTVTLATLYSDNAGTALANPFTNQSTSTGQFFFFANSGYYDIQIAATGLTTFTLSNIGIGGTAGTRINCANYAGTTAGQQIANAYANVASAGDVIDCSHPTGTLSIAADPFTSMSNPVTVIMPEGTVVVSVAMTSNAGTTIQMNNGAILSMNSGTTFSSLSGMTLSDSQHFAGSGTVYLRKIREILPEWWGALADGSTDSTTAIQAAFVSSAGVVGGTAYTCAGEVFFGPGTYIISSQINLYTTSPEGEYESCAMRGSGQTATKISYTGANSGSAFRTVGAYLRIRDLGIVNSNGTTWVAGINYDGSLSTIGRSTLGYFSNLLIDCGGNAAPATTGDGIDIGKAGSQADSLEIDHVLIQSCYNGVATLNANALSINLYAPVIIFSHFGTNANNSTNINVFGGEFDNNDINFTGGCNAECVISGVRTETSKRSWWSSNGTYQQPVSFINYVVASNNTTRPVTTAAINASSTSITFSVAGYVSGDQITVAGAGTAGGTLQTTITACTTLVSCTVTVAASTMVSAGTVGLDGSVDQWDMVPNGGGPYFFHNNFWNTTSGGSISFSNGPMTFIGNLWNENIFNPLGISSNPTTENITQIDNWYNFANIPTKMVNRLAGNIRSTLSINSTTPSVQAYGMDIVTANSNPTTITTFLNPIVGQIVRILIGDANTTFSNAGNLNLPLRRMTGVQGQTYVFYYSSNGQWYLQSQPGYSFTGLYTNLQSCDSTIQGAEAAVTDAQTNTWGANVTSGGGSNIVKVWCNGTNWTVIGK